MIELIEPNDSTLLKESCALLKESCARILLVEAESCRTTAARGLGFKVFKARNFGFRVWGLGFGDSDLAPFLEFRVWGLANLAPQSLWGV